MEKRVSNTQQWRYEKKFIVPHEYHLDVYYQIASHPSFFTEIFNSRYINNIYLDSIDHRFYLENIDGLDSRKKVRLRWYGDLYNSIKPVLEIKKKQGSVGRKESFDLTSFDFTDSTSMSDLKHIFSTSELPELIKQELFSLDIALLNRYSRRYFLSLDKKFRITIDKDLHYISTTNSSRSKCFLPKDNTMIMELKYDKAQENEAKHITNYFPFRLSRNSKYVNGMQFLHL